MRTILGAVIGYITMTVVSITGDSLAGYIFHLDLSSSGSPGPAFLSVVVFVAFLAANIGGFVAAAVSREPTIRPALALIALSLATGVLAFTSAKAHQPLWYFIVLMAVMMFGVLLGVRLRIRSQALLSDSSEPPAGPGKN